MMRPMTQCLTQFAMLASILSGAIAAAQGTAVATSDQRYPASPFVVDVTQSPYSAKGDGVADDTEALQRAINENVGRHKLLYFPKGTYLVSRTLTWPKKWDGRDNWGKTMLRGERCDLTIIGTANRSTENGGNRSED
jgi:hypothetical protein